MRVGEATLLYSEAAHDCGSCWLRLRKSITKRA